MDRPLRGSLHRGQRTCCSGLTGALTGTGPAESEHAFSVRALGGRVTTQSEQLCSLAGECREQRRGRKHTRALRESQCLWVEPPTEYKILMNHALEELGDLGSREEEETERSTC